MASSSTRKRKSSESVDSLQIKTEPNDNIHPLSHYVDDRVELIKQTFQCLKSKVIKSMLPSVLQVCGFLF